MHTLLRLHFTSYLAQQLQISEKPAPQAVPQTVLFIGHTKPIWDTWAVPQSSVTTGQRLGPVWPFRPTKLVLSGYLKSQESRRNKPLGQISQLFALCFEGIEYNYSHCSHQKFAFPDKEWQPWKFQESVPKHFWKDPAHQKVRQSQRRRVEVKSASPSPLHSSPFISHIFILDPCSLNTFFSPFRKSSLRCLQSLNPKRLTVHRSFLTGLAPNLESKIIRIGPTSTQKL